MDIASWSSRDEAIVDESFSRGIINVTINYVASTAEAATSTDVDEMSLSAQAPHWSTWGSALLFHLGLINIFRHSMKLLMIYKIATTTRKESDVQYLGFFNRDIMNGRDCITALAVGILIGSSVVLEVLAGGLAVTPLPED